jgi:GTP-binding protein HflX
VLDEIGAGDVPQILVYNKCDLLEAASARAQLRDWLEVHPGVRGRGCSSAPHGEGLDAAAPSHREQALAALECRPADRIYR